VEEQKKTEKQLAVNVNLDTTPILYTDNISMTVNPDGLVLDIMQRLGPTNRVRIVARIGMSREHAQKFARELAKLLAVTQGASETGQKKN